MKILSEKSTTFHIEITDQEAGFLMYLVQNPVTDDDPKDISAFRRNLFSHLKEHGAAI